MFRHTPLLSAVFYGASVVLLQGVLQAQSAQDVAKVAKAISVKIEAVDGFSKGSGVILQKQGDLYTVLTAAHVLKCGSTPISCNGPFKLTTAVDDRSYSVSRSSGSVKRSGNDLDLAIIQFRSSQNYQVAKIGNSNLLEVGTDVYVTGFPLPTAAFTVSDWVFREGKISANSNKRFKNGYSLVYSNDTLPGMSGGAVLNKAGELVAIHGKGDVVDDQSTSVRQKTGFNFGIPINRFGEVARGMGVQLETEIERASVPTGVAPNADYYYVLANGKYEAGDFQGALINYNLAIKLNPRYAAAYSKRGNLRVDRLKDLQGAIADYNQAIFIDPTFALAYNNRGAVKVEFLNDLSGALADYNQAIFLDPMLGIAYMNRGALKSKLNDLAGALADLNQSIALNHKDSLIYRGILKVEKLNDSQGALMDFDRAVVLSPRDGYTYFYRGWLKDRYLNDNQGALNDYNKAASLDVEYADSYLYRGNLKIYKLGDRIGAIKDFRIAARLYRKQGNVINLRAVIEQLRKLGVTE